MHRGHMGQPSRSQRILHAIISPPETGMSNGNVCLEMCKFDEKIGVGYN